MKLKKVQFHGSRVHLILCRTKMDRTLIDLINYSSIYLQFNINMAAVEKVCTDAAKTYNNLVLSSCLSVYKQITYSTYTKNSQNLPLPAPLYYKLKLAWHRFSFFLFDINKVFSIGYCCILLHECSILSPPWKLLK